MERWIFSFHSFSDQKWFLPSQKLPVVHYLENISELVRISRERDFTDCSLHSSYRVLEITSLTHYVFSLLTYSFIHSFIEEWPRVRMRNRVDEMGRMLTPFSLHRYYLPFMNRSIRVVRTEETLVPISSCHYLISLPLIREYSPFPRDDAIDGSVKLCLCLDIPISYDGDKPTRWSSQRKGKGRIITSFPSRQINCSLCRQRIERWRMNSRRPASSKHPTVCEREKGLNSHHLTLWALYREIMM